MGPDTQGTGEKIRTRTARPGELDRVAAFYRANRYGPTIRPGDVIVLAVAGDELWGALRLCEEGGVLVLRGMRVAEQLQGRGIGTRLLRRAEQVISGRSCWCIAHRHLESFYSQAAFLAAAEPEIPAFLRDRCAAYRRDHGLDVVVMHRPREAASPRDQSQEPVA